MIYNAKKTISYYDGPHIESGLTLQEIDEALKREKEICDSLTEWEDL